MLLNSTLLNSQVLPEWMCEAVTHNCILLGVPALVYLPCCVTPGFHGAAHLLAAPEAAWATWPVLLTVTAALLRDTYNQVM